MVNPPEAVLAPCDSPQNLPDQALDGAAVASFWGQDRAALVMCARRHQISVAHLRRMGQLLNSRP